MEPHTLAWHNAHPEETILSIKQLDLRLDQLFAAYVDEPPILVSISGPLGCLTIGVGRPESVLTYCYADSNPPYLISRSKTDDHTPVDYFYFGHHSQFLRGNLIPSPVARDAVRQFVLHQSLSLHVRWHES